MKSFARANNIVFPMSSLIKLISRWVEENHDECLLSLKEIIEITSPSREEKEVAEFISSKIRDYGFTTNRFDYVREALNDIIREIKEEYPDFNATVIPVNIINERKFSGFYTDPESNPIVNKAVEAIGEIYRMPEKRIWTFATDGRIYSNLGIPLIGFEPREEKYAHTQMDHIRVIDFLDSISVCMVSLYHMWYNLIQLSFYPNLFLFIL